MGQPGAFFACKNINWLVWLWETEILVELFFFFFFSTVMVWKELFHIITQGKKKDLKDNKKVIFLPDSVWFVSSVTSQFVS